MENLRRLYGSQGFINFTPVPETQFDDENSTINLTIDIDEGKQFHVRTIRVLGVDPATTTQILDSLALKPGDLYSSEARDAVLRKFPDLLPNPNPDNLATKLDERNGLVDLVLDFRKTSDCSVE